MLQKQFHDVVGYYNRFDIFKLTVDRSPNNPVSFEGSEKDRNTVATDLTEVEDESSSRLRVAAA